MRLKAYVKNSIFIANHNKEADNGKHSYHLKINQFGDMVKIHTNIFLNQKNLFKKYFLRLCLDAQ